MSGLREHRDKKLVSAMKADLDLGGEEGGDAVTSALVARWGARLSTALDRTNAAKLRYSLGKDDVVATLRNELAADVVG